MVDFAKLNRERVNTPAHAVEPMPTRRCVHDALWLISGALPADRAASMGTSCERYWGIKEWQAAVKTATALHDAGVTPEGYMPKRGKLRPAFRYFRVIATGEEFACLASQVDSPENAGFWPHTVEVLERAFTTDQLGSMESKCIQAEIAKSEL